MSTRSEVVKVAKKYVGCRQGSDKHKDLVNTFNRVKPHGEVGNYSCAWCAIAWTAFQLKAGNYTNVPLSYNCGTLIRDAQKLGIWVENDAHVPSPGDGIIYNWNDTGKGDCKTGASHVGIVEKVSGNKIIIIEGNKGTSKACGRREITVNSRYIRGYICPKYGVAKKAEPPLKKDPAPTYTKAKAYKVQVDGLNVRTGAGTRHKAKSKNQLTVDGQRHSNSKGQLMKGTVVTCQGTKSVGSEVWMKIPSGWVCAYTGSKYYVK